MLQKSIGYMHIAMFITELCTYICKCVIAIGLLQYFSYIALNIGSNLNGKINIISVHYQD